jgi:hypothetical protein
MPSGVYKTSGEPRKRPNKSHLPEGTIYQDHSSWRNSPTFSWRIIVDNCSVLYRRWLWEKENGPLPKGSFVKCAEEVKQQTPPKLSQLRVYSIYSKKRQKSSVLYKPIVKCGKTWYLKCDGSAVLEFLPALPEDGVLC